MAVQDSTSKVPTDVLMGWFVAAALEGRRRHAGSLASELRGRGVLLKELSRAAGFTQSTIHRWSIQYRDFDKKTSP